MGLGAERANKVLGKTQITSSSPGAVSNSLTWTLKNCIAETARKGKRDEKVILPVNGRPRMRWLDDIEADVQQLGVRAVAADRPACVRLMSFKGSSVKYYYYY